MMERLSLGDFQSVANLSQDGDVRLAKGQEGVLVNKGTFGHRVASVLQNVGRALGLLRPDPTRAQRQETAVQRFKEALSNSYGEAAAARAFRQAGLDGDGAGLTGRKILTAISEAKGTQTVYRAQIAIASHQLSAPFFSEEPSDGFAALVERVSPGRDPNSISLDARREFNSRLNKALFQESEYCKKLLTDDEVNRVASRTLKHVLKLESNGLIDGAVQARAACKEAMKSILQGLVDDVSVGELGNRFAMANERLNDLLQAEGYTEAGADDVQDMFMQALIEARSALRAEGGDLPEKAQAKALAPDGPLKALMTTVNDAMMDTRSTEKMGKEFNRMFRLGLTVVGGLAELLPARLGSAGRDVDVLFDNAPLPQQRQVEAQAWLSNARHDILHAERAILAESARQYEGATEDERENVLNELGQALLNEAQRSSGSLRNATSEAREALTMMPGLSEEFSAKAREVIDVLASQA